MAKSGEKVTIKKYANRRLYDTESSTYITLDRLAHMVREGREFDWNKLVPGTGFEPARVLPR